MTDPLQPATFGSAVFDTVRLDGAALPALVFAGTPFLPGGRRAAWLWATLWGLWFVALAAGWILPADPAWARLMLGAMATVMAPMVLLITWSDLRHLGVSTRGIHVGPTSALFVPWRGIESVRSGRYLWTTVASVRVLSRRKLAGNPVLKMMWKPVLRDRPFTVRADTGRRQQTLEFARLVGYYLEHAGERQSIGLQPPAHLAPPAPVAHRAEIVPQLVRAAWYALIIYSFASLLVVIVQRVVA